MLRASGSTRRCGWRTAAPPSVPGAGISSSSSASPAASPDERDDPYRERLRSDYANLRQGLEWAAEHDDERLLEVATSLVLLVG